MLKSGQFSMRGAKFCIGLPQFTWTALLLLTVAAVRTYGADTPPDFHKQIEPILVEHCYECHGFGEKKADVSFDEFKSDEDLLHNPELWWRALRNVRANIMPPVGQARLSDEEKQLLTQWIKYKGMGLDAK